MPKDTSATTEAPTRTIDEEVELARRAFALRQYEQAVDHYATALELQTEKFGDRAPENADLYLAYGKALLEHAITQSSVLGKQGAEGEEDDSDDEENPEEAKRSLAGAFFSFSGDAENTDDDADDLAAPPDSDAPVDLFAEAEKAVQEADDAAAAEDEQDEQEDGDEPEDDFNAAWEILDLARALFDARKDGDEEVSLKLAETYLALGDVSLETEKFEQAITDYEAALALKAAYLPRSSRELAEVHYKLGLVLDMTSGRLKDAIAHVEQAVATTQARLDELRAALAADAPAPAEPAKDTKGKGKATPVGSVAGLSKSQIEAEIKEMEGLSDDLKLKLEELSQPEQEETEAVDGQLSAPALAALALDKDLNGGAKSGAAGAVPGQTGPVNDLTGMVKKKKKADAAPAITGTKRKADEDEEAPSPTEKRARVEEVPGQAEKA